MKEVMSQIAYINLNKMPANKTSSDDLLEESYKNWKTILMAQIELYKPQVIIFGNTFKFFKDDLLEGEDIKPQLDNVGKNAQLVEVVLNDASGEVVLVGVARCQGDALLHQLLECILDVL